jgi:4-alpha-glucanotransferase
MSDITEHTLLDALAEWYGIVPEYHDIWGRRHLISAETKRRLLAAMGVPTDGLEAMRRSLGVCEARSWRRLCDPVLVRPASADPVRWSARVPIEEGEAPEVAFVWELCDEYGAVRHRAEGGPGLVPVERTRVHGRSYARFELPLPGNLPIGYYDLAIEATTSCLTMEGSLRLALVPPRCHVPAGFANGRRTWGLSIQLYALRSAKNWGVGDFGDLAELMEWAAKDLGAGLIGLNPLHALANTPPYQISPYSPDSRLFLNVLYLDLERIPEFGDSARARAIVERDDFRAMLADLRQSEFVDYDAVHAAKLGILEELFVAFQDRHLGGRGRGLKPVTERGRRFERFVREEGATLERFATFQALRERQRQERPEVWVWQEWPEAYRRPDSPAVAQFREAHPDRVLFHQYLQWLADEQVQAIATRARALGMPVGLYHDLALGSDRSGSEAWEFQDVLAWGMDAGCPPDAFALQGQNWGLTPVDPHRLRESGYTLFIEVLRRNLKRGGALRLDHVMGLSRLFWIPRGRPAAEGAYVRYPVEDLLGLLALESIRHECAVIGEDLGTVPDEVRDRLSAVGALSYRVFYFERGPEGRFKAPGEYPAQAVAVATTHDLPTLAGYWQGADIEIRSRLGQIPDDESRRAACEERRRDKGAILRALRAEGLLPDGLSEDPEAVPTMTPELSAAVHAFLARTPSWLMLAALEDVLGLAEQMNVPGTVDAHPNWLRKVPVTLETLREDARLLGLASTLRGLRAWTEAGHPGT